jgi:phosphohistidine phosphatase
MADHTLVLLRHAKSDWSVPAPDRRRPLASRGRRQAPDAGAWLSRHVPPIDLAVVSTAVRARTTWELAEAELESTPRVAFDDALYAASGQELIAVVRRLPEEARTAVLVGHNPGIEDAVALLCGTDVHLVTAAIAVLALAAPWATATDSPASVRLLDAGRADPSTGRLVRAKGAP